MDYDNKPSAAEYDYYERMATDPRFRHDVENPPEDWGQYDSPEECEENGAHLKSCDRDGYCNKCGHP
jgi:hypothetical protein